MYTHWKLRINFKWQEIGGKCIASINRQLWSGYQPVMLFLWRLLVTREKISTNNDQLKTPNNVELVGGKLPIHIKHLWEADVNVPTSDVT